MSEWVKNITEIWKSEQLRLSGPASPEVIRKAERTIGFTFPPELKELYLEVDGFSDDMNPNCFRIWPICTIVEQYVKSDDLEFVGFCDWLINSHSIGFIKNKPGIYKEYDRSAPIADSFTGFLDLLLRDSTVLY